jgi:hypothetical protein
MVDMLQTVLEPLETTVTTFFYHFTMFFDWQTTFRAVPPSHFAIFLSTERTSLNEFIQKPRGLTLIEKRAFTSRPTL